MNTPITKWWREEAERVRCLLCPRTCLLVEGQPGYCGARSNESGQLMSQTYGWPVSMHTDPIEKKPLYHFLPGSRSFSLGAVGCNLGCRFCQNWEISKAKPEQIQGEYWPPGEVVRAARQAKCASISYTYNEPLIWGEFVMDVAKEARAYGMANVMVTAGYVNPTPRAEIFEYIDAANVDLKAFTEDFYMRMAKVHLQPVLDTLVYLRRETNVWIEITNLVIPGENDSVEELGRMSEWIAGKLGPDTPLHFSAFHPDYQLQDHPRTPPETLTRAREIALAKGLRYVYTGNVNDPAGQTTFCPQCQTALIARSWHAVTRIDLAAGRCPKCAEEIAGRFD